LVNAAKLAFAGARLRGVALGYFAFAFVLAEGIGIAPIRLSACKAIPQGIAGKPDASANPGS
jgi:hypothetical protein